MKKTYIEPSVKVAHINLERYILAGSDPKFDTDGVWDDDDNITLNGKDDFDEWGW